MMATLYLMDQATGVIFSVRTAAVDHSGQLTDQSLVDAIQASGCKWRIERDFGLGANRWRQRPAADDPVDYSAWMTPGTTHWRANH